MDINYKLGAIGSYWRMLENVESIEKLWTFELLQAVLVGCHTMAHFRDDQKLRKDMSYMGTLIHDSSVTEFVTRAGVLAPEAKDGKEIWDAIQNATYYSEFKAIRRRFAVFQLPRHEEILYNYFGAFHFDEDKPSKRQLSNLPFKLNI